MKNKTRKLPQAPELEDAVLGAILLERDAFDEVATWLKPEVFSGANQIIYRAICEMKAKDKQIDLLTVTHYLKETSMLDVAGGPYYITQLTNRVASSAHLVNHALVLVEKYIQREILRASQAMLEKSWDNYGDALDQFEEAKKTLNKIEELIVRNQSITMEEVTVQALNELEAAMKSGRHISGASTGFNAVDHLTLGRRNGELTIIAGRPSMGKTSYALAEAWNLSKTSPVAFFSLEMSAVELCKKLQSMISGVDHERITTGRVSLDEINRIHNATGVIERNVNFLIQDCPSLSISEAKAILRKLKRTHNLGSAYFDYLQLMSGDKEKGGNRDQEIGTISRGMKTIAKELQIPVIALSQLSRVTETRNDKKPILSDLRESGNIEQDADVVNFIYRAERYGFETVEINGVNESSTNLMEVIQAKFRGGKLGSAFVEFIRENSLIRDRQERTYQDAAF